MKVHNIQRITIIFCALFLSTFGHDYVKAHHNSRAHVQHTNRNHHLISHLHQRAANDSNQQVCEWQCPPDTGDGDQDLELLLSGDLIGVYNVKRYVALVVDVKHQIGAVFNGTTGGVVLINIKTNKGYDLPSGVWLANKQPFEQFFSSLVSLEIVWNQAQKNGSAFDINSIPDSALHHIAQVFQFLGVEIAARVRNSLKITITLFVKYTKQLIENGQNLGGIGKLTVHLHGDLEWLANLLKGVNELISKLPGGLKFLQDQGIKIRFELIFKAKSGIEAFINLLSDVGQQVNLAPIFKDVLSNPGDILAFIVHLGGDVSTGINGFFKVLHRLIAVHNNKISVADLLETLIRFSTSKNCNFAKIRKSIQQILKLIDEQIKKYNTDDEWSTLKNFLQKLLDPKSVAIGGISVAELLRALSSVGQESPIKIVVRVLWAIRLSIKVQQTIPQLVLTILKLLNSQPGLQVLIKLIPGLKLKYSSTGEIDVVGTIKELLNLKDLLPVLNDLPKLLKRIPIISNVVKAIENALQEVSHGEYNFDDLIKCSGAAKISLKIRAWLKSFLNLPSVTPGRPGILPPIGLPPYGRPIPNNSDSNSGKGGSTADNNSGKGGSIADNNSGKGGISSDSNSGKGGSISAGNSGKDSSISDNNSGKGGIISDSNSGKGGSISAGNSGKDSSSSDSNSGKGGISSDSNSGKGASGSDSNSGKGGISFGSNLDKGGSVSVGNSGKIGVLSSGSKKKGRGGRGGHGGHGSHGGVVISWHHGGHRRNAHPAEAKHEHAKERNHQVQH